MEKEFKPVLNLELLQQKANEEAEKGALDAIKEFYTGYNSPYKKAIEQNLINKGVDNNLDIPDIIAILNDKISSEIDAIANTAIAKTFVPLVKDFLSREKTEVKFSEILEKFVEHTDFKNDEHDRDDYTVEKIETYDSDSLRNTFPTYQISNGKIGYELHFHVNKEVSTLMALPYVLKDNKKYYRDYEVKETMKISLDGGATLEMPFRRGILENDFVRYCARLIVGNCNVEFDMLDFEDSMFPESECHC